MSRRLLNRLYYFTIEDEGMLAEAFARIEPDTYAITYKVHGTDDVFVTTTETKDALDRKDVPYNLLAEEDSSRVSLFHSPLSREELSEHEDPLKCLGLAYRAIAMVCVGVNGESEMGFDRVDDASRHFTYFTAPAGHTFIWRLFYEKEKARDFVTRQNMGDRAALQWAEAIPLDSSLELKSYH